MTDDRGTPLIYLIYKTCEQPVIPNSAITFFAKYLWQFGIIFLKRLFNVKQQRSVAETKKN